MGNEERRDANTSQEEQEAMELEGSDDQAGAAARRRRMEKPTASGVSAPVDDDVIIK